MISSSPRIEALHNQAPAFQTESGGSVCQKTSGAGAPKAPLCKGRCHAISVTEGLSRKNVSFSPKFNANSQNSTAQFLRVGLRRPTSLYTREALVQCKLVNFYVKNDFFDTLQVPAFQMESGGFCMEFKGERIILGERSGIAPRERPPPIFSAHRPPGRPGTGHRAFSA